MESMQEGQEAIVTVITGLLVIVSCLACWVLYICCLLLLYFYETCGMYLSYILCVGHVCRSFYRFYIIIIIIV